MSENTKPSLLDQMAIAAAAGAHDRKRAEEQARQETERRLREAELRVQQAIAQLTKDAEVAGRVNVPQVVLFVWSLTGTKNNKPAAHEEVISNHERAVLKRCRELGLSPECVFFESPPGCKGVNRWQMQVSIATELGFNPEPKDLVERVAANEKKKRVNDLNAPLSERMAIAYSIGRAAALDYERSVAAEEARKQAEAERRQQAEVEYLLTSMLSNIQYASKSGQLNVVVFSVSYFSSAINQPAESSLISVHQAVISRLQQEGVKSFWRFEANPGLRQPAEWQLCVAVPQAT